MLICNYFAIDRKKFIPSQFYIKPSVDKFCQLMKSQKKSLLINIAKMCKVIFEKFKEYYLKINSIGCSKLVCRHRHVNVIRLGFLYDGICEM